MKVESIKNRLKMWIMYNCTWWAWLQTLSSIILIFIILAFDLSNSVAFLMFFIWIGFQLYFMWKDFQELK